MKTETAVVDPRPVQLRCPSELCGHSTVLADMNVGGNTYKKCTVCGFWSTDPSVWYPDVQAAAEAAGKERYRARG